MNPLNMLGNGHPLIQMMQAMQAGGNPMAIMQQLAGGNPVMAQGMRMLQGKSSQQLEQMARNMAKERGIDMDDMLHTFGFQ